MSVLRDATVTWLGVLVVVHVLYMLMSLTRSKVKVKVTGLLNFRQLAKPCMLAAMNAAPLRGFLVIKLWPDLLNTGASVHPYVRPYVHEVYFSDLDVIWCVGRLRTDVCTSMTSTRSQVKVKVMGLLKFRNLHFSRSISSAILAWSSKVMVDHDSTGHSL